MKYRVTECVNGEMVELVVTEAEVAYEVTNPSMTEEESSQAISQWLEAREAVAFSDETFNNYQKATIQTAKYPKQMALVYLSLGIASEAGEVAGKMKKWIRDGGDMTEQEWISSMSSEIGDVLWYAARLADELGLSLSQIAEDNLNKLLDRKARGVIGGSGDNR